VRDRCEIASRRSEFFRAETIRIAETLPALAARSGSAVVDYVDEAESWLERADRGMRMTRVRLRPHIVLENGADPAKARQLVDKAHDQCFIGNSVLTSVTIEPRIEFATTTTMVA